MSILPIIEEAIRAQAPIRFHYVREGKTDEVRVGNPHAVFIWRLKDGTENVYVHLWQTDGASDSKQPLPSWRQCFLDGICDVEVLAEDAPFIVCDTYNPTYYEFPICII